jgi:hypothetical protein
VTVTSITRVLDEAGCMADLIAFTTADASSDAGTAEGVKSTATLIANNNRFISCDPLSCIKMCIFHAMCKPDFVGEESRKAPVFPKLGTTSRRRGIRALFRAR